MRLFTGLELEAEALENIRRFLERLRRTAPIQWTPAGNLHITTKFIGQWPRERLPDLQTALAGLPRRLPIAVSIRGVQFFPDNRKPRVFCCSVEAPGLKELAADTDNAIAGLGIPRETRTFSPHLTLARIRERVDLGEMSRALMASSVDFGQFEARRFFLYESQLRPGGSVYTKLAELALT
ncbi:MAG: RNA 2',3'-cyclic phosphodiesterase [Bryobacteraceae bacterium]|jgi:2'-5' RNA ligase